MRNTEDLGVDSENHSPQRVGAESFQGQVCERGTTECGHSPMEQDSEQLCGWGALRPRALQVFNSPYWALLFLSMSSFLQGFIVTGLINVCITSIERRFDLSSSQSGLIVSSYDIASCICLPFVSYFGGNGHKPRWLGWGIGIMGLGSLVFALPHFTTPPYQATVPERSDMCPSNITDSSQHRASDGLSNYFYVFVLGQLLHGIGATPLYTLGFTFLDENVGPSNAPVFIGVFYTATSIGPLVGMLLGGYFLRLYSDITVETELTPTSPLWVGAWWIGFLLGGFLCLPAAFAVLAYPKKLPGSPDTAASRQSEAQLSKDGGDSSSNHQFGKTVKDMPRSLLLLLRIPTFMFLCLAVTAVNGQIGISSFTVKYFESQFSLSSSNAAQIYGYLITPVILGTLTGSIIVKRFKLTCRGIIRYCLAIYFVGLCLNFMFFIQCPMVSMAGVTVPYTSDQPDHPLFEENKVLSAENWAIQRLNSHRSLVGDDLVAQCNTNCSCDRRQYTPVCGEDDVTYYSPCFAGCSSINLTASGEVFTDCSCVGSNVSWAHGGSAVAGKCGGVCSSMGFFLALYAMSALILGLLIIPPITAILRCVPERLKSFAMGIQWIVVRTLGAIPAPIVFGSLIDQACRLKQSQDQSSCLLYENSQMSLISFACYAVYRVFGAVFYILALVLLKEPQEPVGAENPDSGAEHITDLHNKTSPEEGAKVTHQTSL